MDSLRRLPEGAAYTAKKGRVSATVMYHDDMVRFYATADSVRQLVYSLDEQLNRNQALSAQKDKTSTPAPTITSVKTKAKWYVAGVITGFILFIIILILKKYGTHSR